MSGLHSLLQPLRRLWQRRMSAWLEHRIPPAPRYHLNRHNLFIFPSHTGWVYLGLTVAIFLLGSNYENNLVLALAYLLFSLFVVSMHYCHYNLSGLSVETITAPTGYAGQSVRFLVQLQTARPRFDLQLSAQGGLGEHLPELEQRAQLGVTFVATRRGWLHPGRLQIASHWPLGLLRCWTALDLQQTGLVYPQPLRCDLQLQAGNTPQAEQNAPASTSQTAGMDEMQGLRPYRVGESLSQIAWKQVAQGRGMVSKEFMTPIPLRCWLELQKTTGVDLDERLSKLCYQVNTLEQQGSQYGLLLGSQTIPPHDGVDHQTRCLTALALYENH
jgi:uncharacterized protein (DUF58 family)